MFHVDRVIRSPAVTTRNGRLQVPVIQFSFQVFPARPFLHQIHGAHPDLRHCNVISVWLLSQLAFEKHNQERKAHDPLRTSWISPSHSFASAILSFCAYWINKPFKLFYPYFVLCLNDLDVLRAQRIMGFSILITHKSTRPKNLITWVGAALGFEPHAASHTRLRSSLGQWRCLSCWTEKKDTRLWNKAE